MVLEITLAGDVTIRRDSPQPRRLGGAQARVAFALLTLERQRGVTRDALAEALWPEGLPATWESALRTVVSRVRAFVAAETAATGAGDPLVAHGGRYLLHLPDDVTVDLEAAESDLLAARAALASGQAAEACTLADAGVERLRPPFLADHDGEWVAARRDHQAGLLVTGLELLSSAASALGDHAAALVAANDAAQLAPLRESAHRCRMAAHAAAGNRAEALRAYQQLRTMLADELGVDPSPETETAYLSLLGPLPEPSRAAAPLVSAPFPLVGRDAELGRIADAWRAARAGTPSLLLISGDAGCGKTRLAIEAAQRIGADGALVLLGRCDPSNGTPYQPLVELLDGFLFALPRDWTQQFRPVVREALATLFPSVQELAAGGGRDPAHDRTQLFDAVTEILVDAAGDRPILIVLDDATGADGDSLALLRHLLRHIDDAPLLVLAMARTPLAASHPLSETVRALTRDGFVHHMPLGGLGEVEVRTLLHQLRPADPPETRARLARSLVADTSGNPLMLVELLRDFDAATAHVVPAGVQGLLERKLADLGDAAHELLRAAAVAGQEFDLDVVEHAADLDHVAALDALDESLGAGLITELTTGYRFAQDVARRTLYDSLSEPRRRFLHRQVAEAIELLRSDALDDHAAVLAQHWAAGADPGGDIRAVSWARTAAMRAGRDHAHAEMVRLYEEALAHVPPDDEVLRTEVLTELGLALADTDSAGPRAEQVLLDAALRALRHGVGAVAARATLGLADLARSRPALGPDAAALIDDLLVAPPSTDVSPLLQGRLVARRVELVPDTRELLPPAVVGSALTALGARLDELAGPGAADERMTVATELAALAALADDQRSAAVAAHHQAMASAIVGDWKAADHALDNFGDATMAADRALAVAITRGDFTAVDKEDGSAAAARSATARRQLLVAQWLRGRLADGDDGGGTDRDPADRALLALARGHRGQARLAVHALATGVDPLPPGDGWLHSLGVLALAAVDLGDAATAEAVHAQLAPYPELWCADGYRTFAGTAGFHLGRLAAVVGDLAEAERHLMPALSRHAEMQARPWVALTQHALADVLDARGRASDREWVTALRAEVQWIAADLGLVLR